MQPFKIRKDAPKTEQDFIAFLEQSENVEWWFKQNDEGKDFYAIRYFNTADEKERFFFPDFLLKRKDDRIGVFDMKGGVTASLPEDRETATNPLLTICVFPNVGKFCKLRLCRNFY